MSKKQETAGAETWEESMVTVVVASVRKILQSQTYMQTTLLPPLAESVQVEEPRAHRRLRS